MAYAVRHKYIDYNPIRDAERPGGQGTENRKEIRVLTTSEIAHFLDEAGDQKYRTVFMPAIMSGAGQGELSGLKWSDADWENNQIHIRRTFNNQKWYDTKSKTSNRKIDLGPAVMKELKKWKLASLPNESSLVFPNNAGNPVSHNNMVKRYFEPALKKAGLPQIRFHDLRHTYYSRSEVRTHFSGPTDIFISGHPVVIICVRTYAVVYYAGLLIEQGKMSNTSKHSWDIPARP